MLYKFCVCIPSVSRPSVTTGISPSVGRPPVMASSLPPALSLSVITDTLQRTSTVLPTTSITLLPTSTTTLGSDGTAEAGQVGPIIGGVLAAVVICALILAIVLLSVLLIYKKRNKKYDHKSKSSPVESDIERDWENPVYSSKELLSLYPCTQSLTLLSVLLQYQQRIMSLEEVAHLTPQMETSHLRC